MMLDIDHFKLVNDTYGHSAGDNALQELVKSCRSVSRDSDILGRIGGEEFAICCPDATLSGALTLAERVRQACEALSLRTPNATFSITVSIGLAQLGAEESLQDALHRADLLLYSAKKQGRNRTVVGVDDLKEGRLPDIASQRKSQCAEPLPTSGNSRQRGLANKN